mgnify:CR=1 FL=1
MNAATINKNIDSVLKEWKSKLESIRSNSKELVPPIYVLSILPYTTPYRIDNAHKYPLHAPLLCETDDEWTIESYKKKDRKYQIVVYGQTKESLLPDSEEDRRLLVQNNVKFVTRRITSETTTIEEYSNLGSYYYDWNGSIRHPLKFITELKPIKE